ncbi:MAG: peptidylprolyl isomerase [Clostridia bacterium]|nr:peptidylprolyl isomerase [Clostridia bacterium]
MKLKNMLAVLIAVLMSVSLASCVQVEYPTVLTIDGEEVTLAEYNYFYNMLKLQAEYEAEQTGTEDINTYWETEVDGKTTYEALKDNAYEQMLNLRVFYAKGKDSVSSDDVRTMKAQFKQQIMSVAESSDEVLKQLDTTEDVIDKIAEMSAVQNAYISKLVEDKTIDISAESINEIYTKDYMATKHILISTVDQETQAPLAEDQVAEKKKTAEDLLAQIKGGADFDALMNQYTEDPGTESYPNGYVFTTGEMVPEFEEATKNLTVGQVSDLVETSYGYHIIKRVEINTDEQSQEYQQAYQNIYPRLVNEKATELVEQWRKDFSITEDKTEIDAISLK